MIQPEPMTNRRLTDESVFSQLCNQGFCILPGYLPQKKVEILTAAVRLLHPA